MTTSTSTLQMRKLQPDFGVEIGGVNLRRPLDDSTWAHIWDNRRMPQRGRPWDAKRDTRIMHRTAVAGDGPTA